MNLSDECLACGVRLEAEAAGDAFLKSVLESALDIVEMLEDPDAADFLPLMFLVTTACPLCPECYEENRLRITREMEERG